jgi:tetratricopeptide (TPR) repeat protein
MGLFDRLKSLFSGKPDSASDSALSQQGKPAGVAAGTTGPSEENKAKADALVSEATKHVCTDEAGWDTCIRLANEALQLNPTHDGAKRLLEVVRDQRKPWQANELAGQAYELMSKGEVDRALRVCQEALVLDPASVVAQMAQASAQERVTVHGQFMREASEKMQMGLNAEAYARVTEALKYKSDSAWTWMFLGRTLQRMGRWDDGMAMVRKALSMDPKQARNLRLEEKKELGLYHIGGR